MTPAPKGAVRVWHGGRGCGMVGLAWWAWVWPGGCGCGVVGVGAAGWARGQLGGRGCGMAAWRGRGSLVGG